MVLDVEHTFVSTCFTLLTHSITNKCYTFGHKTTVFLLPKKMLSRHFVEFKETDEYILTSSLVLIAKIRRRYLFCTKT
jgi:hypothetical protein